MASRLHVDPAAPAIASKVALSAQAAAPAPPPTAAAGVNEFDVVASSLLAWAGGTHEAVSTAVRTRGGVVGELSASGFAAVADMDAQNAADLGQVGEL